MFKIGKINFTKKKTILIAEAGVNHNGSIEFAKKLIDKAKEANCDIIKFQTYKAEKLTTKKAARFWKWSGEKKKKGSQFDSYSNLDSFEKKHYKILINYCKKKKIEFLSTPFDEESADMLVSLGMKGFKIASCDITNFELIKFIAKKKLPILLSTGASNMHEIKNAVNLIKKCGNKKILIMHCTLCYPTSPEDANLLAINDIKQRFPNELVGLSDHTLGIDIATASIPLGVSAIEKHFTFDNKLKKSADHWLSILPSELKTLKERCLVINSAMGEGKKKVLLCEIKARKLARRSIVSKSSMNKGEVIKLKDLNFKRPGTGLSPSDVKKIINKKLKKNIKKDHLFKVSDMK
tara:strand:- start:7295 stop:8344 length:1050 start_codon:yes stop_codon:yes gene_type:complete